MINRITDASHALLDELHLTLTADLRAIQSDWNGKRSGRAEDRAMAAEEALTLFNELLRIVRNDLNG